MKHPTPTHSHHYIEVKRAIERLMRIRDLSTKSRAQYVVNARALYMGICKEMLGDDFRLSNCGYYVDRDHSDVIHVLYFFNDNIKNPNWIGSAYYPLICKELGLISKNYVEKTQGILRDTKETFPRYKISTKEKYQVI